MRAGQPGAGKLECVRALATASSIRATRKAETEQTRSLVERLAGGIVQRPTEVAEAAVAGHQDELRVAAGHQQAEDGKDWFLWQFR